MAIGFDSLHEHIQFLPQGEGPIILIMGGLAMLGFSLFAAMVTRRGGPMVAQLAAARTHPYMRHLPPGGRSPRGGHASGPAATPARVSAVSPPHGAARAAETTHESLLVAAPVVVTTPSRPPPPARAAGHAAMAGQQVHESVLRAADEPNDEMASDVWFSALAAAAEDARLGRLRFLGSDGKRHAVLVNACGSCTDPAWRTNGCERERHILEQALRRIVPAGRVEEVSCAPNRAGACIFEVHPGGQAAG